MYGGAIFGGKLAFAGEVWGGASKTLLAKVQTIPEHNYKDSTGQECRQTLQLSETQETGMAQCLCGDKNCHTQTYSQNNAPKNARRTSTKNATKHPQQRNQQHLQTGNQTQIPHKKQTDTIII